MSARTHSHAAGTRDAEINRVTYIPTPLAQVMSPFTPFFTEHMYLNLRRAQPPGAAPESAHFCDVPPASPALPADQHIQQARPGFDRRAIDPWLWAQGSCLLLLQRVMFSK